MSLPVRLGCLLSIAIALLATPGAAEAKTEKHSPTAGAKAKGDKQAKSDKQAKGIKAKKGADKGDKGKKGPQSIGSPNSGHLAGATLLKGSKHLKQRPGAHSWGLPGLVKLLHHGASQVAKKHKGSVLLVGDLSGKTGGHLDGHNSHQTGRDADIGFYVMNSHGKPVPTKRFIAFDANGRARDLPWASFDDARNWALVEAFVKDEKAGVRYLFITNALRGRLLAYAAKKNAPKEIVARAAAAMMSPADADLHDDHFHVRIACPESMKGVCLEESSARGPVLAKDDGKGDVVAKVVDAAKLPAGDAPADKDAPKEPGAAAE